MSPENRAELPSVPKEPKSIGDLFDFYHGYVKLLYSRVQAYNVLPQETLFEINAALDHLSRLWVYDEPEEKVVHHAFAHLKRSCLDVFKIVVRETLDQYKELKKIDTVAIDNGQFDIRLRELVSQIKSKAAEARRLEGQYHKDDDRVLAFEPWIDVYGDCIRFEQEFYRHRGLEWAKKRNVLRKLIAAVAGFMIAVITNAIISAEIFGLKLSSIWGWLASLFK